MSLAGFRLKKNVATTTYGDMAGAMEINSLSIDDEWP